MSKKKASWEAMWRNDFTFVQYYRRLMELSISMFEWKNLPDSVDPRFLELVLFGNGQAVFFKDEVLGYLALEVAVNGSFNVYRIPINRRAYAVNGYQNKLNINNSVIIYNNMIHTNSIAVVNEFAGKLADLDRSIIVNAKAQKTPILVICDENQRQTMLNVYAQYDGNEPVIYGNKGLNPKDVTSITTEAPFVGDKLYALKAQIWNEALTYLGISNTNITKKERLISDEVARNLGGVIASRYSRLESRRQACKEINKMFNLNIWCDYREDYQNITDAEDTVNGEPDSEGEGGEIG